METICNIVVRGGLYYVADFVDTHGMPRVPTNAPGFPSRQQAEEWATKQVEASGPYGQPEVFNQTPEEVDPALVELGDVPPPEDSGDVTIEVPAGEGVIEGLEPEATVEQG